MSPDPQQTLVLDAASATSVVTLLSGDEVVERRSTAMMGQAGHLTTALVEVLGDTPVGDLDTIIAGVGPGSFTGIRICLATALGLVAGVGTGAGTEGPKLRCVDAFAVQYAALIRMHPDLVGKSTLVVVESKRPDLFAQLYDVDGQPTGEAFLVQMNELADLTVEVITGDALTLDSQVDGKQIALIDVQTADYLAADEKNLGDNRVAEAKPFYLRPPDIGPSAASTKPKPKK